MVDNAVVVEFARDVIDDERHGELEDHVLAMVIVKRYERLPG